METIHDTPLDLIKVQRARSIVERIYNQRRRVLKERNKEILEHTIAYLEKKLDDFERAETVRKKRSPDYSPESVAIDRAKDYWELKDNLEKHQIHLDQLSELVVVLKGLKEGELPSFSTLSHSKEILDKLEDYILSKE